MKPIYALIIPLYDEGAAPGHPLPGQPPGIWGPPGPWPTPPIHMPPGQGGGGQPPGIWGPPGPWPTPPIAFPPGWQGGQPPGFWGPNSPSIGNPIANAPGVGHHPSWGDHPSTGPGFPTPPIHIPPTTLPDLPNHIWGPTDPRPNPPIYLPTPTPPAGTLIDWKVAWSPETGWVVIGTPNVPHPAPAKK
jgi:hypothetical protein